MMLERGNPYLHLNLGVQPCNLSDISTSRRVKGPADETLLVERAYALKY